MTFEYVTDKLPDLRSRFFENVSLKRFSSMKTGGISYIAMFPENAEELAQAVLCFEKYKLKYNVIGNASNILFSDSGYDDRIIVFTSKMKNFALNEGFVCADCGVSLTKLALTTAKAGRSGLEFAYGIPASVGGAVYMNAGAYGGQISDVAQTTEYFDPDDLKIKQLSAEEHCFGYRTSFFKGTNKVILSCKFKMFRKSPEEVLEICKENMDKRTSKQPLNYPSCGSAFKRPEGYFAGALIEQCGLKGFSIGGAQVSELHAGFIVNKGGATTNDVLNLLENVKNTVLAKTGVELEPEILYLE